MNDSEIPAGAWMMHAGTKGELLTAFQDNAAVALDWPDIGDLSSIPSLEDFKVRILRQFAGRSAEDIRDELKNLLWFVRLIALGDYLLLHNKATDEVMIGQVISNVEHNITLLGPKFPYIRRVKWLKKIARDQFTEEAQADLYSILPLEDLRTHRYEIHRRATDEEENINIEREMFPPYEDIGTLKALVREWAWETEDFFQAIQDIRRGGRRD